MSENSVPVEPAKIVENRQGGISSKFIIIIIGVFIFLGIVVVGLVALLINNMKGEEESSRSSTTTISTTSSRSMSVSSSASSSISSSISSSTVASGNVYLDLYFSKDPESEDDYSYFASVDRVTTRLDVATFLTEEYLKGPSATEQAAGFYVGDIDGPEPTFTDASNCSGKDFGINIVDRVATLRFCRTLVAIGGAYDARFLEGLKYNINQFDTVDRTIVLDKSGHCLFDLSGTDECLE
jgi:hypothetical protein